MCGRTVQTIQAVRLAASMLRVDLSKLPEQTRQQLDESRDNYNLSPGMDAWVFTLDGADGHDGSINHHRSTTEPKKRQDTGTIRLERKVWGLITRNGTVDHPIEPGMGKHFNNLMFNARADTLYERPTFVKLLRSQRSCLIAVDGFFEWKSETGGLKQPYFVSSSSSPASTTATNDSSSATVDGSPVTATATSPSSAPSPSLLLLAGLWTSVTTGNINDDGTPERLDTFTIITTDACESLRWLHSRMPLAVADATWLYGSQRLPPPPIDTTTNGAATAAAATTNCTNGHNNNERPVSSFFRWHAVTREMTSMKFRSAASIRPLPKLKTVQSMFAAAAATAAVVVVGNSKTTDDHKKSSPSSSSTGAGTITKPSSVVVVPVDDATTPVDRAPISVSSRATTRKRPLSTTTSPTLTTTTPTPPPHRPAKRDKKNSTPGTGSDKKKKKMVTTATSGTIDSFFRRKNIDDTTR